MDMLDVADEQVGGSGLNLGAKDCLLSSGQGLETAFEKVQVEFCHCKPSEVNLLWFEDESVSAAAGSPSPSIINRFPDPLFSTTGSSGVSGNGISFQSGEKSEVFDLMEAEDEMAFGEDCLVDGQASFPMLPPADDQAAAAPPSPPPSPPKFDQHCSDVSNVLNVKVRKTPAEMKPKRREMKRLKKLLGAGKKQLEAAAGPGASAGWKSYSFSAASLSPNNSKTVLVAAKLECIRLREGVAAQEKEIIRLSEINMRLKTAFKKHQLQLSAAVKNRTLAAPSVGQAAAPAVVAAPAAAVAAAAEAVKHSLTQIRSRNASVSGGHGIILSRRSISANGPSSLCHQLVPLAPASMPMAQAPDSDTRLRIMIQGNHYMTNPGLLKRFGGHC